MIRAAARVLDEQGALDELIVSFVELGSEGALLRLGQVALIGLPNGGATRSRPPEYLIARDGHVALRHP
jgi:hypothetical protein